MTPAPETTAKLPNTCSGHHTCGSIHIYIYTRHWTRQTFSSGGTDERAPHAFGCCGLTYLNSGPATGAGCCFRLRKRDAPARIPFTFSCCSECRSDHQIINGAEVSGSAACLPACLPTWQASDWLVG